MTRKLRTGEWQQLHCADDYMSIFVKMDILTERSSRTYAAYVCLSSHVWSFSPTADFVEIPVQVLVVSCGLLDCADLVWWQPYHDSPAGRRSSAWLPAAIEVTSDCGTSEVLYTLVIVSELAAQFYFPSLYQDRCTCAIAHRDGPILEESARIHVILHR